METSGSLSGSGFSFEKKDSAAHLGQDSESLGNISESSIGQLGQLGSGMGTPKTGSKLSEFRDKHAKCIEVLRKASTKSTKELQAQLAEANRLEPKKDEMIKSSEMILACVNELWQETGANFVKHEKNIEGMRAEIAGLTTQVGSHGPRALKESIDTLDKMAATRAQDSREKIEALRGELLGLMQNSAGRADNVDQALRGELVKLVAGQQEQAAELRRLREDMAQCDRLRADAEAVRLVDQEEKGMLKAEIARLQALAVEQQRLLEDPTRKGGMPLNIPILRLGGSDCRKTLRSKPVATVALVLLFGLILSVVAVWQRRKGGDAKHKDKGRNGKKSFVLLPETHQVARPLGLVGLEGRPVQRSTALRRARQQRGLPPGDSGAELQ